jgi:hypothetical protein
MALMLNQKGKTLMHKKMYQEALDVLVMAEVRRHFFGLYYCTIFFPLQETYAAV